MYFLAYAYPNYYQKIQNNLLPTFENESTSRSFEMNFEPLQDEVRNSQPNQSQNEDDKINDQPPSGYPHQVNICSYFVFIGIRFKFPTCNTNRFWSNTNIASGLLGRRDHFRVITEADVACKYIYDEVFFTELCSP